MKKRITWSLFFVLVFFSLSAGRGEAQNLEPIRLLPPQPFGGMPLMQALNERKSSRAFSPEEIPMQALSDLLWAANGINRPETGYRTAPSARNMQEIEIYVAKAEGLYLYDPAANLLRPVLAKDIRSLTGQQDFVSDAPLNLIFVADLSKMKAMSSEDALFYAATDTGYVSQNVYLYCASRGLATVVRGMIDVPALTAAMGLGPGRKIILAQTVGYPR